MLNRHEIIGHLGQDPTIKNFEGGGSIANCTVATTEKWKNKEGEPQSDTQWHNVVFRGGLVGVVEKYLKKGSLVYISGTVKQRSWEVDGVKKYMTEIHCQDMKMLGGKSENAGSDDSAPAQQQTSAPIERMPANDSNDDLPF